MIVFWLLLVSAMGMVIAQDVNPGAAVYHDGWYNALDVALFVLAAWRLRALQKKRPQAFTGLAIAAFGGAIVVLAGAASGLMGPDTHTVIGAPGASVRDDDAGGSFTFPLKGNTIDFSSGRSSVSIGGGRRYWGGFIFREQPRTVLDVDAGDAHGNHLTITQPTNASFLSPVLLLQQRATINGMDVAVDAFSVPAASRNVKVVFFTAAQAAQMPSAPVIGQPAILFAVADSRDKVLANGFGLVAPGVTKKIAGLTLSATVTSFPAVVVASAPYWPVLLLGLLLVVAGALRAAGLKTPSRSRT